MDGIKTSLRYEGLHILRRLHFQQPSFQTLDGICCVFRASYETGAAVTES
jgi:hypothetical protein